jgi:hypothetical protein
MAGELVHGVARFLAVDPGDLGFEVEDRSAAPALRMAKPLARLEIDREGFPPAVVERTRRPQFLALAMKLRKAGFVISEDFTLRKRYSGHGFDRQ